MQLNRGKDFRRRTGDSPATFYRKKKLPEDNPERIPEPDGYLNGGATPVWLDSTIDAYIARVLEHSRVERQAKRVASRRTARTVLASA